LEIIQANEHVNNRVHVQAKAQLQRTIIIPPTKAASPPTIIILLLVFQAEGAEPMNVIGSGIGVGVDVTLRT
jgi:hypothetical protein